MTDMEKIEFWNRYNLIENDWQGLTSALLSELFSKQFLIPIEESDENFSIEVEDLTLKEFGKSLMKARPRDPMDKFEIK